MGWGQLIVIVLKILKHFLKARTPAERKVYLASIENFEDALVRRDADSVNSQWRQLHEQAREGDPNGFGD